MMLLAFLIALTALNVYSQRVPLVAIPVDIAQDQTAYLEVFEDQSVIDAVTSFCQGVNIPLSNVDMLVEEVKQRWDARMSRVSKAKEQEEITNEIINKISVPISITVPLTLDIQNGEDVTVAAISFVRKYDLNVNQIPIVQGLLEKHIAELTEKTLEREQAILNQKLKLFSLTINVEGSPAELDFFEGDVAKDVASNFLAKYNLLRDENVNILIDTIESNLKAL